MTSSLAGRIAVITGGGSGLGAAMASVFADAGMGVATLDIDGAAAQRVAEADTRRVRGAGDVSARRHR